MYMIFDFGLVVFFNLAAIRWVIALVAAFVLTLSRVRKPIVAGTWCGVGIGLVPLFLYVVSNM